MHELYQKLARLAVRRGVNVQKGQPLIIRADVRDHVFIEMLVKEAYEAGAGSVSVDWKDQTLNRMDYEYQTAAPGSTRGRRTGRRNMPVIYPSFPTRRIPCRVSIRASAMPTRQPIWK